MESLFVAIGVIVILCILVVGYFLFLRRVRVRVRKAWLAVYEMYLARADKIPLLIELARREMPEYESLYEELIVARAGTAGMFLFSPQKQAAEEHLGETLDRVIREIRAFLGRKHHAQLVALLHEFEGWDVEFQRVLIAYRRTLRLA